MEQLCSRYPVLLDSTRLGSNAVLLRSSRLQSLVCWGVAAVLQSRRVNVSIVLADYTDMWAMRGGWHQGMQIGSGSGWDGLIEIHNATSQSIEHTRHSTSDTKQLADEDGSPLLRLSHADRLDAGSRPAEARWVFPLSVICIWTTEAAAKSLETGRALIGWWSQECFYLVYICRHNNCRAVIGSPAVASNLWLSNPWLILPFFLTFWIMV